jgi:hypothetical protein
LATTTVSPAAGKTPRRPMQTVVYKGTLTLYRIFAILTLYAVLLGILCYAFVMGFMR